jgi:hypothetical protein
VVQGVRMVWKKDLAKLKQELKEEDPVPVRTAQPKPVPKPVRPMALAEEDALFLSAMGRRPVPPPVETPLFEKDPAPMGPAPEENFLEAMGSLKGLKRAKPRASETEASKPDHSEPVNLTEQEPESVAPIVTAVPIEPPPPVRKRRPAQFQLAAGMAIEVDGVLDLSGHSPDDALERLRERVLDGQILGWRTFHLILGSSEELTGVLRDYLGQTEGCPIVRYAQAPIPMGGAQAWILYYAGPAHF